MTTPVFPTLTGQSFIVSKAPTWSTIAKKAASGRQTRVSLQSAPIWQFKLQYEYLRDRTPSASDLQNLFSFFNTANGSFLNWYFQDPTDYSVTAQNIGVGNGSTTTFQLGRTTGSGFATPFFEPIYAVIGTPTYYVNGTATTGTLGSYGTVTFASAPASSAIVSWTGSFYFVCHFLKDDGLSPSQMVKGLWSEDGLEFESVIP